MDFVSTYLCGWAVDDEMDGCLISFLAYYCLWLMVTCVGRMDDWLFCCRSGFMLCT